VEFVGFAGWLLTESVSQKSHSCTQWGSYLWY